MLFDAVVDGGSRRRLLPPQPWKRCLLFVINCSINRLLWFVDAAFNSGREDGNLVFIFCWVPGLRSVCVCHALPAWDWTRMEVVLLNLVL
jgi:hypothetical protein